MIRIVFVISTICFSSRVFYCYRFANLIRLSHLQAGDRVRAAQQRRNELLQEIAMLKQQLEENGGDDLK
jgi:hypothetical protein